MKKRTIADYIQDIIDTVDLAILFVEGMTFEDFCQDTKTILAIERAIQIIGEAAKKIPESIRKQYPEIPWRNITGMRDKVTHEYFGINLKLLWDTTTQNLPQLKILMPQILENVENAE